MEITPINLEKETLCARIYIGVFFSSFVCGAKQNINRLYFVSFNCTNRCWEEYVPRDDPNSNVLNNNENKLDNVKKSGLIFVWCNRLK